MHVMPVEYKLGLHCETLLGLTNLYVSYAHNFVKMPMLFSETCKRGLRVFRTYKSI